jgi:hypothetical protein
MSKAGTFAVAMFLALTNCNRSRAQNICSTARNNLICVIPQVFSTTGGVNLPNQAHHAHFDSDFQENATALTSVTAAVGSELTALRLASPASGVIFAFDKNLAA